MHTVNIIDPNSGKAHEIPYDQLPDALEAGGEFADETQKQKAIGIQNGTWKESKIPETPLNPMESGIAETPFNGRPAPPAERTGITAPFIDLAHALSQGFKGAVKFAHDSPENYRRIKADVAENGLSAIGHQYGQGLAEIADLQKSAVNTPHDFAKYLLRKGLAVNSKPIDPYALLRDRLAGQVKLPEAPRDFADTIPSIPEDTGVEKGLGLQPNPERGDELTRGLIDVGGIVEGGRGLYKLGKKVVKAPDLHQAIRDTQKVVNESTAASGRVFDKIEKAVEERGITNIPMESDLLKKAKGFLADTPENADLIARAKKGDYKAIRGIQKDLRIHAEKALASKFESEHKRGKEIGSVRDRINKGLENYFSGSGNEDLAKDLRETRTKYRDIKETYFSTPALAKVFGKSQKVPKNPKTLLTEESTEMKRFMEKHPEVAKATKKAVNHESKMKLLRRLATVLGIGTTAGGTYGYVRAK